MLNRFAPRNRADRSRRTNRCRTNLLLSRLESREVPANFIVTNTADTGPGSLRNAIAAANLSPDPTDNVIFNITPLSPTYTISLASPLQFPNTGVSIDATTQPGWSGSPVVVLDGFATGAGAFPITGSNISIRGLVFNNFQAPAISITGAGAKNVTIAGNYIGVDSSGLFQAANGVGDAILIGDGASSITIGGPNATDRNIISTATSLGNTSAIHVNGSLGANSSSITIRNNYIGVGVDGLTKLNPASGIGLFSPGIFVEGGDAITIRDNVVGGWDMGVFIQGTMFVPGTYPIDPAVDRLVSNVAVAGNFIGTDATGSVAVGNLQAGIQVGRGSSSVTIGGPALADQNVISGNGLGADQYGVVVSQYNYENLLVVPNISNFQTTSKVNIEGNQIGTNAAGTAAVPNSAWGIQLSNGVDSVSIVDNLISGNGSIGNFSGGIRIASDVGAGKITSNITIQENTIGADETGAAKLSNLGLGIFAGDQTNSVKLLGNLISGNNGDGVAANQLNNGVIQGNIIGLDGSGLNAMGNGTVNAAPGISLYGGATNVLIGGPNLADRNYVSANGITGNGNDGIRFGGSGGTAIIQNNFVGTDKTGLVDFGNSGNGIRLEGGTIGVQILGNLVSGNENDGIALDAAANTIVRGNIGGLSIDGSTVIKNGASGIAMFNGSNNNVVGGPLAADRNVFSGNGVGVYIGNPTTTGNTIQNNYLGTDLTGAVAKANNAGLLLQNAPNNIVDGNVMSGNSFQGMFIEQSGAVGNTVKNNLIGVAADGKTPLGNGISGIGLYQTASLNTIGGVGQGNVISSNGGEGIAMYDGGPGGYVIQGNWIGTDKSGKISLPNNDHGIRINNVPNVTVGGVLPGEANVIANNVNDGVTVEGTATGALIRGNKIYDNGGLGIDLNNDGVSVNDTQDPDLGANLTQNFPIITSAKAGANTEVSGSLNSLPNLTFTLDFYASATADPSGNGEGGRYLGSTTVTTDNNGDATYTNVVLTGAATVNGEIISATATEQSGNNTSEFAANVTAVGATVITVTGVQVNDGSKQHSRVTSITVTFSSIPTLPVNVADAFTLNRISPAGSVTLTGVQTGNQVKLTFSGGLTTATSLNDGNYELTVIASQVSGGALDGNNNGTPGDNYVETSGNLFRLFGDLNGDRKVDSNDFILFRATFNQSQFLDPPAPPMTPNPAFNGAADANGDGKVDSNDFIAFRTNFNSTLAP